MMNGGTKAAVARAFETSTRSIGRWMEKHNYDAFVEGQKKQTVAEVVEAVVESKAEEPATDLPKVPEPAGEKVGAKATVPEQAHMLFESGSYAKLWEFKKAKKKRKKAPSGVKLSMKM